MMGNEKAKAGVSDELILVRGHHLLCILGFRGHGYSQEFVSKMTLVADRVMSEPETILELTNVCDAICAGCPHKAHGCCAKSDDSETSTERADMAVLERIECLPGTRISAGEALQLIGKRIGSDELGTVFCRRCGWRELGYCAEGLASLAARTAEKKGAACLHLLRPTSHMRGHL